MGGVSEDSLAKELTKLLARCGIADGIRMYDLRGSINSELNAAGVSFLDQRYVTGHGTKDILNQYVSLAPRGQMPKYFATIQPLLAAMKGRADELGMVLKNDGIDRCSKRP